MTNDITRELIKALPRLFIKYQTDQNRIANALLIPSLMNLDLYLEMRMISVRLLCALLHGLRETDCMRDL